MSAVPSKDHFRSAYAGQAPWDIPKAQQPFIDATDRIQGSILDAGCGTGETAMWFANHGRQVTGIDFIDVAIERARRKVIERGVWATFLVKDALTLVRWDERFDCVVDSGLFHCFADAERARYVDGLTTVVKPGGRLFLLCFSDQEPGTEGPRRISRQEIDEAFAQGWVVESVELRRVEVRAEYKDVFSEGGPKVWFATIRRDTRAPLIKTVVETVIYGDDLDAMEAFYATVLGLQVLAKEAGRHVFFRVGNAGVFLVFKAEATLRCDTLPRHGARGPVHFALGIESESYEAWRSDLTGKGVAIEREITWPLGGRSMYFRDPAGNLGELATPGIWGTPAGW
jgi:SAM-dependent methyltransferase